MSRKVSKRKQPAREVKQLKQRTKITSLVLDDSTLEVLVHFINIGFIKSVDYPIAQGKEALVFRCTSGPAAKKMGAGEFVAAKIYKYETSSFQTMIRYIDGDHRFSHVKHQLRPLIQQWTKKEFANLQASYAAGVPVPKPFVFRKNVLFMEFLGIGGVQYALLKDVVLENPQATYLEVLEGMKKMLRKARLVHADLNEYNIVFVEAKPIFIDVSQAVPPDHPSAKEFFEKDVENITKYFKKEGVQTADYQKAFDHIAPKGIFEQNSK